MIESELDPIVIVGARRSGTTLLQSMLAGHPDLLVHLREAQFFLELAQRLGRNVEADAALDLLVQHRYCDPLVEREALANIVPPGKVTLHDVSQAYVRVWQRAHGRTGVPPVFKHPRLIFHLDLVLDLFPGVTIVNVVRDPRANVASQLARWPRMSLWTAISWWRRAQRAAIQFSQANSSRLVNVVYEELLRAPQATLSELCDDLGIRYHPGLLAFELTTRRYRQSSAQAEVVRYTGLDTSRLTRWRETLPASTIWIVERFCRNEMTRWGYQPTPAIVSKPQVLSTALIETTRWGMERGRRLASRIHSAEYT